MGNCLICLINLQALAAVRGSSADSGCAGAAVPRSCNHFRNPLTHLSSERLPDPHGDLHLPPQKRLCLTPGCKPLRTPPGLECPGVCQSPAAAGNPPVVGASPPRSRCSSCWPRARQRPASPERTRGSAGSPRAPAPTPAWGAGPVPGCLHPGAKPPERDERGK